LVAASTPSWPAATPGLDPDSEKAKFLLRQRERTIDNVKRLFAVVFAVSFTTLGRNAFDSMKEIVLGHRPFPPWHVVVFNLEMLAVFTATASVFYHQGTKFLDWRYASRERDEAVPLGFASDFFIVVVTMIPFILMANSIDHTLTDVIGFTAFFFFVRHAPDARPRSALVRAVSQHPVGP
jgi:hypothetical protein